MSLDLGALARHDDDRERPRKASDERAGPSDAEREREALRVELRDAEDRALAANRARSEFLATMSHEMRTPLNAVLGYTDLLALGVPGDLNEDQRVYLDRIRNASGRLLALINGVLDLAKMDAGRLVVGHERASAAATIARALELVAAFAESRGVSVVSRCAPDAEFVGDARRVEQIVHQLLSNGVRSSTRGGTVDVSCSRFETPSADAMGRAQPAWCAIRVEDAGVGIGDEHQQVIFEPFGRVDDREVRGESGTRLGLAIARRLARLMDGDLTVSSRLGAGSAFTLWLPAPAR
ncbi:MAG TPA: HAMP domain-containing sensor histidine kinase [Gemmatimonadaceae bacterium]